jgi:hypothetical protein
MTHSRWTAALAWGGLAVCLAGCGRPSVVGPAGGEAAAAEPAAGRNEEAAAGPRDGDDAPSFRFPDDAGGALLAKVLPPTDLRGPLNEPNTGPRRLPPPAGLDAPAPAPVPAASPAPPHPPGERNRAPLRPRLVSEETLPGPRDPAPPQPPSFFAGDRTRLPSVDANQPPPLPHLTQYAPDRAALGDPTGDASSAAALSGAMPRRAAPAPYSRLTLPDPFENRKPVGLPTPPDDAAPRTGPVQPPK